MKSVFKAFMLAALLAIPAGTYAQSSFFHAGLVASGGIDGLAGGLAIGLGDHLQIRGMYGYMPEFSKEVPVTINNPVTNAPETITMVGKTSLGRHKLLVDIFPSAKSSFHFTVGAYYGSDVLMTVSNKEALSLEYRALGVSSHLEPNYSFCADKDGFITAQLKAAGMRPYAGIGWGGISRGGAINACLDLGVQYWGEGTGVYADAKNVLGNTQSLRLCSADVENEDQGLLDKLAGFPVCPILALHLYIRLF